MPDAVCRMLTLVCPLVVACPSGTNLGVLHLLWMLASGRLLGARGALFPGLADCVADSVGASGHGGDAPGGLDPSPGLKRLRHIVHAGSMTAFWSSLTMSRRRPRPSSTARRPYTY